MRFLTRLDLPAEIQGELDDKTTQVENAADPRAESDRLWTGRGRLFDALRARLAAFGSGRQRCMYCEDSAGTDIDHFHPRTRYPLRTFEWLNHLLACADCNRRKSQTFPVDDEGASILVNPTSEDPREHIAFSPSTGRFVDLTERGRQSIQVYALNRGYLAQGRMDAWRALQELIIAYANYRDTGEEVAAGEVRALIARSSFSFVFVELLDVAQQDDTQAWLRPECVAAIDACPEMHGWF